MDLLTPCAVAAEAADRASTETFWSYGVNLVTSQVETQPREKKLCWIHRRKKNRLRLEIKGEGSQRGTSPVDLEKE